jgi:hypothetical protein
MKDRDRKTKEKKRIRDNRGNVMKGRYRKRKKKIRRIRDNMGNTTKDRHKRKDDI